MNKPAILTEYRMENGKVVCMEYKFYQVKNRLDVFKDGKPLSGLCGSGAKTQWKKLITE